MQPRSLATGYRMADEALRREACGWVLAAALTLCVLAMPWAMALVAVALG